MTFFFSLVKFLNAKWLYTVPVHKTNSSVYFHYADGCEILQKLNIYNINTSFTKKIEVSDITETMSPVLAEAQHSNLYHSITSISTFSPDAGRNGAGLKTIVVSVLLSNVGGGGTLVSFTVFSEGAEFSRYRRLSSVCVFFISSCTS